ncbi:hypothetical protein QEV55_07780 [Trueperella pyogenes]|uniref:hypothetical protein n=1 Tax=Trueperella pyogenes TaxID=1661 RepID=UPI00312B45D2
MRISKGLATSSLVLVSALGLTAGTQAAYAQPVIGDTENVPAQVTCEATSLTITLPKPNPFDRPSPGDLPEPTGAGFKITVQQVKGVDLTSFAGWDGIEKMTTDEAKARGFVGEPRVGVTNAQASVSFKGLPIGLYMVSGVAPEDPHYKLSHLDPFLVSVPLGAGETWDCAVNIQAKTHYSAEPKPIPTPPTPTPPEPPQPPRPPLSHTGAAVMALGGASLALLGAGMMLVRVRREKEVK